MKRIFNRSLVALVFLVVLFAGTTFAASLVDISEVEVTDVVVIPNDKLEKNSIVKGQRGMDDYRQISFTVQESGIYFLTLFQNGEEIEFNIPLSIGEEILSDKYSQNITAMALTADKKYSLTVWERGGITLSENDEFSLQLRKVSDDTSEETFDEITGDDDTQKAGPIEALLTRLMMVFGDDILLGMLKAVLGQDLSINTLVYNEYEATRIDFYKANSNSISTAVRNVVNNWFNILTIFTYICYVIILVFIAIMIITTAGTQKQEKAKSYIQNWIVGLALLYIIPKFLIPTLIDLNDAFVKFMSGGHSEFHTYYNDELLGNYILGSDSATKVIEKLEAEKNVLEDQIEDWETKLDHFITIRYDMVVNRLESKFSDSELVSVDYDRVKGWFSYCYGNFKEQIQNGKSEELAYYEVKRRFHENVNYSTITNIDVKNELLEYFDNIYDYHIKGDLKQIYEAETQVQKIDTAIETVQTDLMTIMRIYTGQYQRLIYAVIWYSLLFQLIALTFIYFKRLFVLAILIAIFPLIMLFYCIDKMSDGSAQTLSLWFKELLTNIFVQSVHAIIYTVVAEMGIRVFENDPTDWIIMVAALLMMILAEALLRELFGLKGSTVGGLGGIGMKLAAGAAAARVLATSWQGKNDKEFVKKQNDRFNKLQAKQNRADAKANIRSVNKVTKPSRAFDAERTMMEKSKVGQVASNAIGGLEKTKIGQAALGVVDKFQNSKLREGMYHVATDVRKFEAKALPKVDNAKRILKNTAAITGGVMYGVASGGDPESMLVGAEFAKSATGRTKGVEGDKAKIKDELTAAYNRKAGKP